MYISFADVKEKADLLAVAELLELELKESDGEVLQYRAPCPACKAGGPRALAITPSRGFFCNSIKRGGDVLALYSHVKGVSFRQAAEFLATHFKVVSTPTQAQAPAPTPAPPPPVEPVGLKPLENLEPVHELLKKINLPDTVAVRLGAGYCKKGLMAGHVALPLRLPNGQLIGYIGVKEAKLPSKWSL